MQKDDVTPLVPPTLAGADHAKELMAHYLKLCKETVPALLEEFNSEILWHLRQDSRLRDSLPLGSQVTSRIDTLRTLKSVVLILGEMKAGKSTFLNTLLYPLRLPVHVNPCSSNLCTISYGRDTKAIIYPTNGSPRPIDLAGLSGKEMSARLRPWLVAENRAEEFEIARVELFFDHPLLESGLVFVDSPGLNENEMATQRTVEALQEAPMVLLLLSCTGGGITRELLRTFQNPAGNTSIREKLIKANKNSVFLVGTWVDAVQGEQVDLDELEDGETEEQVKLVNKEIAINAKKECFVGQLSDLLLRPYAVGDHRCFFIDSRDVQTKKSRARTQPEVSLPEEYQRLEESLFSVVAKNRVALIAEAELQKLEGELETISNQLEQLLSARRTTTNEKKNSTLRLQQKLRSMRTQHQAARGEIAMACDLIAKQVCSELPQVWLDQVEKHVLEIFNDSAGDVTTIELYAQQLKEEAERAIRNRIVAVSSRTVAEMVQKAKRDLQEQSQQELSFLTLALDTTSSHVELTAESLDDPVLRNRLRLLLTPAGFLGGGGAMAAGALVIGLAALPAAAAALGVATLGGLVTYLTTTFFLGHTKQSAADEVKRSVTNSLAAMKKKFIDAVDKALRQELNELASYIDGVAEQCIGGLELKLRELMRSTDAEDNERETEFCSSYLLKTKELLQKVKGAQALLLGD